MRRLLIQKARTIPMSRLHTNLSPLNPPPSPTNNLTAHDWFNFILGISNCVIISSVLWGFESYNEKLKMIEDTNTKISEIIIAYKVLEKQCRRYITKQSKFNSITEDTSVVFPHTHTAISHDDHNKTAGAWWSWPSHKGEWRASQRRQTEAPK